jgi:hypothetical protein
MEFAEIAS